MPHLKCWAAGHKGPNSSGRTTATDPLPTWERVRCRHVSLMRGTQYRQQEPWTVNFFLATPTYAPMYLKIYEVSSQTKVSVPRDRGTPSSCVKEADLGG